MKKVFLALFVNLLALSATYAQFTVNTTNVTCNGACNGTAQVSPSGNYFYQWSTGDTSVLAQGFCAGTYSVTVLDPGYLPLDTLTFNITEPTPIIVSGQATNAQCFGTASGSIFVIAQGGTPAYTYMWNNGMVTTNAFNLPTGVYCVTVVDANACSATNCFTVLEPIPVTVSLTTMDVTMCGGTDGTITASITGGSAPYTYMWSNGSTVQNPNGLSAGTYILTLTDANGCTASASATVNSPLSGVTATFTGNDIDCQNLQSNATLTILNGTGTYTIDWGDGAQESSNPNFINNHIYTQAGVYTIIYYDGLGCGNSLNDTILNNGLNAQLYVYQQPTCGSPSSGSVFALPFNGSAPYFYLWSNTSTNDTLYNLTTGTYTVTITDSTGCTVVKSITLQSTNSFTAYAYGTTASCVNGGVGSATIVATGGVSPYSYAWGTNPVQTTQVATNLAPGLYTFTVTDNTGCVVVNTSNIAFSSYGYYVYLGNYASPNCGNSNGAITAYPYGATPPYSYLWSNNQTTPTASGLAAGTYSVTVTDAGGCTTTGNGFLQSTCYNTITGTIFTDNNSNCTLDGTDAGLSGYTVTATNGTITAYGYAGVNGTYNIEVHDTGTFTIHIYAYGYTSCSNISPCGNANPTVTFHTFNNTATQNFGFTGLTGFDLALHPGWTSANPGFPKDYWIYYFNQSQQAYNGPATVVFKYDNNLIYQSSGPPLPAHDATAHTLTWNVTGVGGWDRRGNCHFTVPASLPAGYHLQSDFYIFPTTGDCDSSNNHQHYSELVTSSLDPNEKQVLPAGDIYEEDSVLTYTIHFQNTGTDTTWFVILKDTLDTNLDPVTVRNLASSHEYAEFNISGSGILTWVFNPIYLVDSATNEPASKGFVTFSIQKKKNLSIGTPISNTASIYFDYNTPVVTNTVTNHLADPNYVFEVRGDNGVTVSAFPNPFSESTNVVVSGLKDNFDFTLLDITGRIRKQVIQVNNKQFEINRDELSTGVYFYRISTGKKQQAVGKLVVE